MNKLNLSTKKGDTFDGVQFQIKVDAAPLDLTGCQIRMQIRNDYGGRVYLDLRSISADQIIITDAVNGIFRIVPRIIDLDAKTYKYDIQITFPSGEIRTWIEGLFTVINDVTRP